MNKAIIKIAYRQIIDSSSEGNFEKNVINGSYGEFLLKSQAYNPDGKFKTFSELKANDGRANSLHYKSGFGVAGYIEQLNKQMPAQNSLGRNLRFDSYEFELIESDITDKATHKVAIIYTTEQLTLLDNAGDHLLLAYGDKVDTYSLVEDTFLLKLQPGISIVNYKSL